MIESGRRQVELARRREELLPRALVPVFNDSFVRSSLLYDEFTYRLALEVLRAAGMAEAAREAGTTEEIAVRGRLEPEHALVPLDWILRQLAAHGVLGTIPAGKTLARAAGPSWLVRY